MQIYGRHYHNAKKAGAHDDGAPYVIATLMTALASKKMHDLGVSYPALINPPSIEDVEIVIPVPRRHGDVADAGKGGGGAILGVGASGATAAPERKVHVRQFQFRVQFVWQSKSAAERATQTTDNLAAVPATGAPSTSPSTHTPARP